MGLTKSLAGGGSDVGDDVSDIYTKMPPNSRASHLFIPLTSYHTEIADPGLKMDKVKLLRRKVAEAALELENLKQELQQAEEEAQEAQDAPAQHPWKWPLQPEDYERYGRQLIIPNVGVLGQTSRARARRCK